jgi:hypothetical protein
LAISALSLLISYLTYRRGIKARKPLASATITPVQDQPSWYRVNIRLESRDTHGYSASEVWVIKLRGARGLSVDDAYDQTPLGRGSPKTPLPKEPLTRRPTVRLEAKQYGTSPYQSGGILWHTGDTARDEFFLLVRRKPTTLRLILAVKSDEAVERITRIRIVREFPKISISLKSA